MLQSCTEAVGGGKTTQQKPFLRGKNKLTGVREREKKTTTQQNTLPHSANFWLFIITLKKRIIQLRHLILIMLINMFNAFKQCRKKLVFKIHLYSTDSTSDSLYLQGR